MFFYTYDSLVSELSKKMVRREEMLVPEDGEVTIGDHESIYNWIKAIDFDGGKSPAIEATFSSDGGRKTVRVDTEKQSVVGSLEEKASKEDLLYSMALTEAKMKVVSAIAEEVNPAVAFQISDYRKEMGKMRDEILENKKQVSNFEEVMHSALSRKNVAYVIVVAGLLMSSCVPIVDAGLPKPIEPTANPAMTKTFIPPTETSEASPTEVAMTEMPGATYELDLESVVFPSVSAVKEAYEKGEYEGGLRDINQWVLVWNKMGVFEGLEIKNNDLSPVLLDGQARIVCVRTNKETILLCPPLDMINGGLKAVPEEEKWDETDKPLSITLRREELTSGGSGTELVYQLVDKYKKIPTRYIDSKTGLIGKGDYLFPEEIVLPVIVPEKMNSIEEYDLGMEFIDSQGVYKMFIEGLMSNEEANGNYWRDLLRGNVTYDAFMNYLRNSVGGPENKNYWWPMTSPNGVEFKTYGGYYNGVNEIDYSDKNYGNGVYLDGIYYSFFCYYQYKNDLTLNRFVDQIMKENYDNFVYPIVNWNPQKGTSFDKPDRLSGLLINNNRLFFMVGSMSTANDDYRDWMIGTIDGKIKEIDLNKISAEVLTYIKGMRDWKNGDTINNSEYCSSVVPNSGGCRNGIPYLDVSLIVKFE